MTSTSSTHALQPVNHVANPGSYGGNVLTAANAQDIFLYLLTLPPEEIDELYTDHVPTCKAVFRNLKPLAKHYVLRMVLFDRPVPLSSLSQVLVKSEASNEQWRHALDNLIQLRIILKSTDAANGNADDLVQLNPRFRETFLKCMSSLDSHVVSNVPTDSADEAALAKADRKAPTLAFLREYSTDRWETVLKYMVGAIDPHIVDEGVKMLLDWSGLAQVSGRTVKSENGSDEMADGNGGTEHIVTKDGFQFMLQDTRSQVWTLLREYLNTAENRRQKKNEILQFLFELSFSIPGKAYMVKPLTKTQRVALRDFAGMFGLVYMRKEKSRHYYPTPLAAGILTNTMEVPSQESLGLSNVVGDMQQGYIIVETNYRVYAYTNSALQIALLYMFISLEYSMPNLVVGMITRESIRTALMHGVTADQILGFLYMHAHPQMRAKTPVIPETVADQIRLWEKERNRMEMFDAFVYDKFPNVQGFQMVEQYARDIGALLWSSQAKLTLACRSSAHEQIKEYIRTYL